MKFRTYKHSAVRQPRRLIVDLTRWKVSRRSSVDLQTIFRPHALLFQDWKLS
jgi:hypothetical protein